MTRRTMKSTILAVGLAVCVSWLAAGQTGVTSVKESGGDLVIQAAGKSLVLDGTYRNSRGGQWIEFRDGEPVALSVGRSKERIRKVTVERGGKVVFETSAGEIVLGDGKFENVDPPGGQPEPQPRPNPNAFSTDDGAIASVWIGGSV